MRVNLERARWVIGGLRDSFVLVNLPAFKAYLIRDGKNVWETRAQIGARRARRPTFRGDMRYLVFNPDWTVPPTILAQDVLGGHAKGAEHDREEARRSSIARAGRVTVGDRLGERPRPGTSRTRCASRRALTTRSAASSSCSRTSIDLPARHAEPRAVRRRPAHVQLRLHPRRAPAGSGGRCCSRAGNWTGDGFRRSSTRKQETVLLKEPLPVLIVYWTVSVGAVGRAPVREGRVQPDAAVLQALDH